MDLVRIWWGAGAQKKEVDSTLYVDDMTYMLNSRFVFAETMILSSIQGGKTHFQEFHLQEFVYS